jgi:hypothetical protein
LPDVFDGVAVEFDDFVREAGLVQQDEVAVNAAFPAESGDQF